MVMFAGVSEPLDCHLDMTSPLVTMVEGTPGVSVTMENPVRPPDTFCHTKFELRAVTGLMFTAKDNANAPQPRVQQDVTFKSGEEAHSNAHCARAHTHTDTHTKWGGGGGVCMTHGLTHPKKWTTIQ